MDDLDKLILSWENQPRWKKYLSDKSIGGYNLLYWFRYPYRLPNEVFRQSRTFIQRGRRGYADSDTWSLDSYLLSWLPEAVAELIDGMMGHPGEMTFEEWQNLLVEIQNGLFDGRAYYNYEWETQERADELHANFLKAWNLMGKYFGGMWN